MPGFSERLSIANPGQLADDLADFIKRTVEKEGRTGCVLGNSGGVDSALVATLAVRALGTGSVHLFFLPERDTHKDSRPDAYLVADQLGLEMREINITPVLRKMGVYKLEPPASLFPRSVQEMYTHSRHEALNDGEGSVLLKMLRGGGNPELQRHMAYYSTKNRVRMTLLYHHAELENCLVLGTCNRSEKMTGLFIKYGDGACDLAPLDGLYKTQVFELARYLDIPTEIIDKEPIGDLAPGLTDEGTLTMGYAKLDKILAGIELQLPDERVAIAAGADAGEIAYVKLLIAASESMRRGPYTQD